jgi:hypothetical protein
MSALRSDTPGSECQPPPYAAVMTLEMAKRQGPDAPPLPPHKLSPHDVVGSLYKKLNPDDPQRLKAPVFNP